MPPPPPPAALPKSILKKPYTHPLLSDPIPRPPEQTRAIQHAQTLISQNGRDLQPPVPIEVYERLCELPRVRSPPFSASSPAPQDAAEFLSFIPDFLPREYLDLIEERNCTGLCGYALCGRPRRRVAATYKILRTGIADADEVNKWCSEGCARRAYYVKVQLDDPSYVVRGGETKVKVELKEEKEERPPQREEERVDGGKAGVNAAALAAERGEAAGLGRTMEVTIREKGTVAPAPAPAEGATGEDAHLMLEGYRTAFGTGQDDMDMDDDDNYLPATIRM
ncbi:hypothetical protein B0T18DRAFT_430810 [Schizothecium vesticola]|uniref:RNA polymerase II subunit B1 CTD phosphatase RPAP2 homolog n=1 Tax=Schizothecium vesticola TaxID=314040 RepID=A0AA40EQE9_9PEZI|nr:hypothetical protein B0T18DRAFT_430810 [Schizothecium vesticola]